MSAIDNTPVNKNFLSPLNFKFQLKRAPNLNFFIQKINIPGLGIPETEQPNPFVNIPQSGDHIDFEPLYATFKVDEDLKNYLEIHNWLIGLGFPESYNQYRKLSRGNSYEGEGVFSDITLLILNSTKLPNFEINFEKCFPVSLSGLIFDTTKTDVDYLEATVEFRYDLYTITKTT